MAARVLSGESKVASDASAAELRCQECPINGCFIAVLKSAEMFAAGQQSRRIATRKFCLPVEAKFIPLICRSGKKQQFLREEFKGKKKKEKDLGIF